MHQGRQEIRRPSVETDGWRNPNALETRSETPQRDSIAFSVSAGHFNARPWAATDSFFVHPCHEAAAFSDRGGGEQRREERDALDLFLRLCENEPMVIIDFHTHIVSPEVIRERDRYLERDTWFRLLYTNPKARLVSAEQLIAAMDRNGIDMAVTFGFAWAHSDLCAMGNDYVADALKRYPDRLIGFAAVNPSSGQIALREVERCAALGFRGVGELMPDGQGYALSDARAMAPLMGWLVENRYPLLVHTSEPVGHAYPGKGTTNPAAVYSLAQRHPRAIIVCAHWGGGLLFYELMPKAREVLANVYYDTAASPYLYDARAFQLAAQFARDKILFATDFPLLGYGRSLEHLASAGVSVRDRQAILGGNAERLLGLPIES